MTILSPKTYTKVPDQVDGVFLDPNKGWFSVIVPAARTNYVTNPSFETGTTGYTATGGASISTTLTQQSRGIYSLKVVQAAPGTIGGCYYDFSVPTGGAVGTPVNTNLQFSVDLKGGAGRIVKIYMTYGGNPVGEIKTIVLTSKWQRVSATYSFVSVTTPETGRLYVEAQDSTLATATTFYMDGVQLEDGVLPSTYIDGDQSGFLVGQTAYGWNGVAHASTSYRIAQTRAGGIEYSLKDLGFELIGVSGLGMPTYNTAQVPIALGGAVYQKSIQQPRSFVLAGVISANSMTDMMTKRADLIAALCPEFSPSQEMYLRFHRVDECEGYESNVVDIKCVYTSGLEGNITNPAQEQVGLAFTQFKPTITDDIPEGAGLFYPCSYSKYNGILSINEDLLTIDNMNGGTAGGTGVVNAIDFSEYDKCYYIGGNFTSVGGVAANNIIKYDPYTDTFSALGVGVNNTVYAIRCIDNDVLVGGAFTTAGGAAANYLACYRQNLSSWLSYDTTILYAAAGTLNGAVRCFSSTKVTVASSGPESRECVLFGGNFDWTSGGGGVASGAYVGFVWKYTNGIGLTNFASASCGTDYYNTGAVNPAGTIRPVVVASGGVYGIEWAGVYRSALTVGGVAYSTPVMVAVGYFTQVYANTKPPTPGVPSRCTFTCSTGLLIYADWPYAAAACPGTIGNFWIGMDVFGTGLSAATSALTLKKYGSDFYIGGNFTSINSVATRVLIAKLSGITTASNGTLSDMGNAIATTSINAIENGFITGSVFAGGSFSSLGSLPISLNSKLALRNAAGTWERSFPYFGTAATVNALSKSRAPLPTEKAQLANMLFVGFGNSNPLISMKSTTIDSGNKDIVLEFRYPTTLYAVSVNDLVWNNSVGYTLSANERVFFRYRKSARTIEAYSTLGYYVGARSGSGLIADTQSISVLIDNAVLDANDNNNQLSGYSLNGITTTNCPSEKLWLDLTTVTPGKYKVLFYNDSGRTNLVAKTEDVTGYTVTGWKEVQAVGGSGISGWVYVDAVVGTDADIEITIPFARYSLFDTYRSLEEAMLA